MERCTGFHPCNTRGLGRRAVFLLLSMSLMGTAVLDAQEEEPPAAAEEATRPKITFHGYLTQAYAQSDGYQILGITEDGVADYRTAALQIRADIGQNDSFVVQLSHERLGDSPVQVVKDDDVELDWIFYEHRFGNSAVKVGRVQIPFGIYNEIKDVGVLLPFYRPSHNFYGEAAYSSETVDGIVASHTFSFGDFGLDVDVHFGDWEFIQGDFQGGYIISDVDDSMGIELWLDTPLNGFRAGAGAMQYQISTGTGEEEWSVYHVSLVGEFDRITGHAELKVADVVFADVYLGYAHLGVALTDKLTLNLQNDLYYFKIPGLERMRVDEDRSLGLSYAFNPSLVLKVEHHWNEGGFWVENGPPFGGPLIKTRYGILSLSTAF